MAVGFDESILFLSSFGKQCNKTYSGTAINEKFKEIVGDGWIVSPWNSATPLSGELLQTSLDALLQNDINLLSAYPDAYFKPTDTESVNVERVTYTPTGLGRSFSTGNDGWGNAMTLSSTIGTVGTEAAGLMLGSLVPAVPFLAGAAWNYGLFGVENGEPKWYPVDVSATLEKIDDIQADTVYTSHVTFEEDTTTKTVMVNGTYSSLADFAKLFDNTNELVAHVQYGSTADDVLAKETVLPVNCRLSNDATSLFVSCICQHVTEDDPNGFSDSRLCVLKFTEGETGIIGTVEQTKVL